MRNEIRHILLPETSLISGKKKIFVSVFRFHIFKLALKITTLSVSQNTVCSRPNVEVFNGRT